ncbi:DEAD/DEAH box helicase [uncultured Massilia sp.]|uniref:DEAD/DEAH box helicase n=1 Tax=uncultured Massilia sp. TaxID=169973 RepID=UPI00258FD227|nr:DEAD/DEAH box helicase [uncultured Massilia sp.]
MNFTAADIARNFDHGTFARGEDYARRGKVIAASFVSDRDIEGKVSGSGGQIYYQTIGLKQLKAGIYVEGDCTCPMDYNCKHVVAVLLASLEQLRHVAPGALDRRAEAWLQQLAAVQSHMRIAAPVDAVPDRQFAALLMPDPNTGIPRLHLIRLRFHADGNIKGAGVDSDLRGLLAPPSRLGTEDEELVRQLASLRAGAYQQEDGLTGPFGARVLTRLCAAGSLWWADSFAKLKRGVMHLLQPGPVRRAQLGWHADTPGEETVRLGWRFDGGAVLSHVLPVEPMHYLQGDILGELAVPEALASFSPAGLLSLVRQAPALQPEQRGEMARRLAAQGLDRVLPAPQALETRQRDDIAPVPQLLLDSVMVGRGKLQWHDYALLTFDYDGLQPEGDEPALRRMNGDAVELVVRNLKAEAAALKALAKYGFAPAGAHPVFADADGALLLPGEEAWVAFARQSLGRLQAKGWQIEFGGNYRYELVEAQEWYAELNEEGERAGDWFALELGVLVDGRRHALLPMLVEMIRKAPREFDAATLAARDDDSALLIELPDSTRLVLPWGRVKPILLTLGELFSAEHRGDALRLPVLDAARLAELERAAQLRWMGGERLRELGSRMDDFAGIRQVAAPAGLQATLRPYQQAGLSWMQFLREYGFGGILADDMGLGKTIQTLAHILCEKEAGRLDAPALVVAPTSLMGNWQAEAARFAPGLRVLLLHGKDRAASFGQVADADLVLTTYPLLGRDEEALRAQRFHLLILDEAQYIKNSRSRAAQVACLLEARHRLCLTGTPVQNHLGELWSQFHFLMPGLLGDDKAFNKHFRKPIEQQGDSLRKEELVRRIRPFMLRRTKDKVATELPPKTEIVLPVDFAPAQRDLYETVRLAMDRKVRDEIDRKGLARSQIVILDALLKLRQVCCDPRLLKPARDAGSAKLEALMDLLETLLSEGRKVLVFSQFTSMLAIIEAELAARAVDFVLLTGDTVDRQAPIAAFQEGSAQVFLISLKAGGVGLNLTAADTVIHYDPWWNPASENQATDRAWRIGQEQPVFVYKLLARGTLEEKIQDMQRRKGELAHAVLDAGAASSPAIGMEDLQAIFAPLSA